MEKLESDNPPVYRRYLDGTSVCDVLDSETLEEFLPDYRRRGIASDLVKSSVAALPEEGITRVCLNVMETNELGKKFWISNGWERKNFLGFYSKAITDKENLPLFEI